MKTFKVISVITVAFLLSTQVAQAELRKYDCIGINLAASATLEITSNSDDTEITHIVASTFQASDIRRTPDGLYFTTPWLFGTTNWHFNPRTNILKTKWNDSYFCTVNPW